MSQEAQADQSAAAPDNPVGASLHPQLQASLVFDVAINVDEETILEAYGLQSHQLEAIKQNPYFQAELKRVLKQLEEDGATFRMKAQVQAEAMLERSWALVHAEDTPRHVVADLIKATTRWAGYDGHSANASVGGGAQFSVSINLGSEQEKKASFTIEHGEDSDAGG